MSKFFRPRGPSLKSGVRVLSTLAKLSAATTLAGTGTWYLWSKNCYFEPFGPDTDPIFHSEIYRRHNPGDHPSLKDSCVRSVPLERIPRELVDDALGGGSMLLERFCAGMWGGYGYAIQRDILARLARNESNKESILWDKKQLLNSTYEKGTNVTDHFVVVGKTPRSIVLWGAEAPSENPGVPRAMENIAEVTADVDVERGVAEFRLKNILYNGVERTSKELFPPPIVWLHYQYCKLLVEGGVSHCMA